MTTKKVVNSAKIRLSSADGRNGAEISADERKSLKERQTAKTPNGVKRVNNQKATSGLTASGCKRNNNGNGIIAETHVNTHNKSKDKTLSSVPQESDEGGRASNFTRPPDSVEISRHGLAYGRRVYLALGYQHGMDSPEATREINSFASKYDTIRQQLSALSPPSVDAVLSRGLHEASKIAKRPANKNKGAVWHTVMDKLATAQQQRSPP